MAKEIFKVRSQIKKDIDDMNEKNPAHKIDMDAYIRDADKIHKSQKKEQKALEVLKEKLKDAESNVTKYVSEKKKVDENVLELNKATGNQNWTADHYIQN